MSSPGASPVTGQKAVAFRWDLDKTYLRTEFETFRQLVRIPFETAQDKVHLPGVPQLIRGLRRSAEARGERPYVFFLSASPPQIGAAIRQKLELDGVEYDGITFKDQLRNLMRGRIRSLTEQVGYKLAELLEARVRGPAAPREILFGDDWESDPLIYSLYADALAGVIDAARLREMLMTISVERGALSRIVSAAEALARTGPSDAVARIYINLERRTPPGRFRAFGARLVPAFSTIQTAASLFEMGLLDPGSLADVADAMAGTGGLTRERTANALQDLVRRGHLLRETPARIQQILDRSPIGQRRRRSLRTVMAAWFGRARTRDGVAMGAPDVVALPQQVDWNEVLRDWSKRGLRER